MKKQSGAPLDLGVPDKRRTKVFRGRPSLDVKFGFQVVLAENHGDLI
jgi:hypothetical protein